MYVGRDEASVWQQGDSCGEKQWWYKDEERNRDSNCGGELVTTLNDGDGIGREWW